MCRSHYLQPSRSREGWTRQENCYSWDVGHPPQDNIGPGPLEHPANDTASGGLGHFGILWANALGAEVYAISHSSDKKKDALDLGAKEFICTNEEKWAEPWAFTFDFILNCADMTHTFNLSDYMSTLAVNGEFHNVGLPDEPLPKMMAQDFAPNGSKIGGSHIGSRPEMLQMLKLASEKNIKPIIQTLDISAAGCKEAVEKVKVNDVRYRFTLMNFDKAFPGRD